ncbi:MAG: AAA family ATPase [Candidatus Jorgensenbacteria bacterium]
MASDGSHSVLKRVELQGFKSFAPKTVFEFPSRVTAIVGPNGSGKSNILDAFRWVLGEREAKQLRGDTLENLIFAGTPKRPPAGFARVGLYFDNRDRLFEHEAAEVAVERKVDRSGVSQFFIHGGEVRLRDLISVFARARLGSRGLTMVGQGQSDIFVRSNPRERREMIEEVLGLREFRLKKDHAERQLASSQVNMEKVAAILEELTPHLRFLRRQRHRFERRQEIADELRTLENEHFSARYRELTRARASLEEPLRVLREDAAREREVVAGVERALKAIDERIQDRGKEQPLRAGLNKALEERAALEREFARVEARIEFASRAVQTPSADAGELVAAVRELVKDFERFLGLDDLGELKKGLEEWAKKLHRMLGGKTASPQGAELEETRRALREKLEAVAAKARGLEGEAERLRADERKASQDLRAQVEHLESGKSKLRDIERRMQEAQFEGEKVNLRLEELTREWESAGRERHELASLPVPAGGETELEGAERRMVRLRGEIAAIGEIDEALVKEAQETETRHSFLSKELEDLTKAVRDLKNLIKDLDQKIHHDFKQAFRSINDEFNTYFRLMFGGGRAHLKLVTPPKPAPAVLVEGETEAANEPLPAIEEPLVDPELSAGVEVELNLPKKKITSLDMLSGGEKSLVSMAALFALIAVSPPPFLVLDEIDAALDEENARRFAELVRDFSKKTQFIIVTHNRATMEVADVLYGITMEDDGVSRVLSLKLD